MSATNRQWILKRRPVGDDFAGALDLVDQPVAPLTDGDVLIRNAYLSLDAGARMFMTERTDSYMPPTPLGAPVFSTVVGVVTDSRHPEFNAGDLVRAYGQWADLSVTRPDEVYCKEVSWDLDDLRQHVGVFGANGWTAYVGVVECGRAQPGETFVVSAAAGVTGALAGQVAKIVGCRVIGIAGTDEKCAWITDELGFDGAINYKRQDVEQELARLCPEGIDVDFENVGGPMLDAVLANMALFGRVAVCGLLENYDKEEPVPGPYRFDLVLMKRLRIEGFFSPDFYHRGPEINAIMQPWYDQGRLRMVFDVSQGLESAPAGFARLFTGANTGKAIVDLADPRTLVQSI